MKKEDFTYGKVRDIMHSKGYDFTIAENQLNMIGVRSVNRVVNNWDDFFLLLWMDHGKPLIWIDDHFTTDPGIYYMQTHILNPKGCGILAEGQHKHCWNFGLHGQHQYPAFIQTGGTMRTYRDRNLNNYMDMDPATLETGWFGCNQHHGYESQHVNNNSAMCQVHQHQHDLQYVLDLAHKSGAKVWDYTLLNEADFK